MLLSMLLVIAPNRNYDFCAYFPFYYYFNNYNVRIKLISWLITASCRGTKLFLIYQHGGAMAKWAYNYKVSIETQKSELHDVI